MIRINRYKLDQEGRQIIPSKEWFERSQKARAEAIKKKGKQGFRANLYGADEVRACLRALSSNKCAYCESPFIRMDLNVEHYRPKSKVHESPDHLGYYWLAYEWSNLLPACQHCNQIRNEPPIWGATRRVNAKGKADKFPLADETNRAHSHKDNIENEEPLLINPTIEEPSEHIQFDPLGKPIPLSEKGRASVEVYNLDTRFLNQERRGIIQEVVKLLRLKDTASQRYDNPKVQKQAIAEIESSIRNKIDDSAYYAGAARGVINNPVAFGLQATN